MENRLFLLQDPVESVPTGLTSNILADVDVTPEKDYSGKITLTQLNAYSGELKAEALTNFKTIKIEKDGSESFTNVAKWLLELQQGGGADDAREEADIAIASVEGDEALRSQISDLGNLVNRLHNTYEAVEFAGYELSVASPESNVRWVPSQDADGVRTRFAAKDGMSFGEGIIAILNGVVVTPEDGNIIMSQHGPYAIGFEFNVAPTVGDIVEFYAGITIGKAGKPYEDVNLKNEDSETAAITDFDAWSVERSSEITEFETEISQLESDREKVKQEMDIVKSSLSDARAKYNDAESVESINKLAEEIKSLTIELADLQRDHMEAFHSIEMLNVKLNAAKELVKATTVERTKAADAFASQTSEYVGIIDMFVAIREESVLISNGGSAE